MAEPFFSPATYKQALTLAARAHGDQRTPKDLPYVTHVTTVAMEVMAAAGAEGWRRESADLGIPCALLHDVLEDTDWSVADLRGAEVAPAVIAGVQALTKDPAAGDKAAQMADSLRRLQEQPAAVQAVKLADRISNLDPPPAHWSPDKIAAYADEAERIHQALQAASPWLAQRLADRLADYRQRFGPGGRQ